MKRRVHKPSLNKLGAGRANRSGSGGEKSGQLGATAHTSHILVDSIKPVACMHSMYQSIY
jgi:hypothetical protein